MGAPLLDPRVLERLAEQAREIGEHGLVAELIECALASVGSLAEEIDAAAEVEDFARLRSRAHRMKGVLWQIGALRMGEKAARVEALAGAGDRSAVEASREMNLLREQTLEALRAHLRSLA
ncbi:MAG: Hpt domain-containing protein [Deltaproteobacteria bacterium]|jgi:HPt (histidine-containing phosphotransfer) domain-containing protein